jgi:hypothetical protein
VLGQDEAAVARVAAEHLVAAVAGEGDGDVLAGEGAELVGLRRAAHDPNGSSKPRTSGSRSSRRSMSSWISRWLVRKNSATRRATGRSS